MRIRIWTTLCLLAVASCSRQEEPGTKDGHLTVTIGTVPGIGIDSRTALGDDGFTIRWAEGDRIALWALTGTGDPQLAAAPFTLYSFNETYRSAKFTGTIDPMPEAAYTYGALSPVPASTEGTKGIYSIPAVQDGAFHSEYDVMAAAPVHGGALVAGDNSNAVSLAFTHKVHLLKIRIPENRLGEPVAALRLSFPVPVAGTLKVDAAAPDTAPELTDGSKVLTLEFPAPVDAGAVVYALIAPVELDASVPVALTAICETGESKSIRIPGKNFAEGHSTPITFTIPEMGKIYTKVRFSIEGTGEETLGEKIERFTVIGPEGCDLGGGARSRSFEIDAEDRYEIVFKDGIPDGISGQPFSVTFESENALVSKTFEMPQLTPETINTIPAFQVPYLMEENFDRITTFSNNENKKGVSDPSAIWIPGTSGWSAARVGGQAGKCVRIVGHREGAWGAAANYEARMDSAPLSGIKEGRNVSVRISFNFNGETSKGTPHVKYGTSAQTGLISGANDAIASQVGTFAVNTYSPSLNGSYDNVPHLFSYTTACSNQSRIVWVVYNYDDSTSSFVTVYHWYYVYIDNVRVSIVK